MELGELVDSLSDVIKQYAELKNINFSKKDALKNFNATRKPLFEYCDYVSSLIKPLIKKNRKLSAEDTLLIHSELCNLLNCFMTLQQTSQNKKITVKYAHKKVEISGWVRGALSSTIQGVDLCDAGHLILNNILQPMGFNERITGAIISSKIDRLIKLYQNEVLVNKDLVMLGKENKCLIEEKKCLKLQNEELIETVLRLNIELGNNSTKISLLSEDIELLRTELDKKIAVIESLKAEREDIMKQLKQKSTLTPRSTTSLFSTNHKWSSETTEKGIYQSSNYE